MDVSGWGPAQDCRHGYGVHAIEAITRCQGTILTLLGREVLGLLVRDCVVRVEGGDDQRPPQNQRR